VKNSSATDEDYMRLALGQSEAAIAAGEVPVGAIVVADDTVIAAAHNLSQANNDPTAHAEILALRQAAETLKSSRLDGATLYVTVEPCLMCAGALLQSRIERLVYGVREPRTGGIVSIAETLMNPAHTHRIRITEGVLEAEAAIYMKKFFQSRR